MEFSELFSFFIILKESFLLLPKIWKFTVPTTAISIVLPSFFFLLYRFFDKVIMDMSFSGQESKFYFMYIILMFISEFIFIGFLFVSLKYSGILTTIVSAAAYTGQTISPSDLLSRVREAAKRPKWSANMSVKSAIGGVVVVGLTLSVIFMDLINPITIGVLIVLWVGFFIITLKSSIGRVLVRVVSVLEEASNAVERSEQLVEGQRLKVFMWSLFMNILVCGCVLVFWMIIGDKGYMNFTVYGLLLVIGFPVFNISASTMLTVLYFQCKKDLGEETDVFRLFEYTKLPVTVYIGFQGRNFSKEIIV